MQREHAFRPGFDMKTPTIVLLVPLLGCASAGNVQSARLSIPVCSEDIVAVPQSSPAPSDSIRVLLRQTKLRGARVVETDTPPELANTRDVQAELVRRYPRTLRDAGVGGTVTTLLVIDTVGAVTERIVVKPSGHLQLDLASERVITTMRFTPALAGGCRAPSAAIVPVLWSSR
jgi:TonB family protein